MPAAEVLPFCDQGRWPGKTVGDASIDCGPFAKVHTDDHKHYERLMQSGSKSSVCSTTCHRRGRNCVACGNHCFSTYMVSCIHRSIFEGSRVVPAFRLKRSEGRNAGG